MQILVSSFLKPLKGKFALLPYPLSSLQYSLDLETS